MLDRMICVQYGEEVVVQESRNKAILFESFAEFNRCITGISTLDLSGKIRLNYEPVRGIHDDDGVIKAIPYEPYELLLDRFDEIQANHLDSSFGLSGDALIEAEKTKANREIDDTFFLAESSAVFVTVGATTYQFLAGFQSSLMVDSARTLAENLGENTVQLWDFYDEPHLFSKAEANTIAIAIGLSFRENYTAMKAAKKVVNG